MSAVRIQQVKVGDRIRQDLGDLSELMGSMQRLGQLQPIVVDSKLNLIAGARRLEAARRLGWPHVKAIEATRISDALSALEAEQDENTCRLDFTPTELVALGARLLELERPKAEERKGTRTDLQPAGNLPAGEAGRATEKVAAALGTSRRTYEKAKAVVDAIESEDEQVREVAQEAAAEMDRTGKVDPGYQKVREQQKLAEDAVATDPGTLRANERARVQKLLASFVTHGNTILGWDLGDLTLIADDNLLASIREARLVAGHVVELLAFIGIAQREEHLSGNARPNLKAV